MPCGFFSLCKKKGDGNVTLKEVEPNHKQNGGVVNPVEKVNNQEEIILELKNQNESLKRIANQATQDLTALEKERRELEKKLDQRDAEIRRLKEILRSVQPEKPTGDLKKRRSGHIVPYNEENLDVKRTAKTPEQRAFLKEAIHSNYFMKHLNEEQVNEIVECVQRTINQTGIFIKEGTYGDRVFILESGEVEVTQNSDVLTTLKPPTVFGELAILYNCKRTATVTAKTPTKVWTLERNVFVSIMKTTTNTRRDELTETLLRVPLLKNQGRKLIGKLIEVLDEENFKKGDYIVRQGEYGETFYIILEGEVDVTETGLESEAESFIRTIGRGSYFGEKALRNESGKRGANVIAKSKKVRCMTLEKKHFHQLIGDRADKNWDLPAEKEHLRSIAYPKKSMNLLYPRNSTAYQKNSVIAYPKNSFVAYPKNSVTAIARKSKIHRLSNRDVIVARESRPSTILQMPKRRMHSIFQDLTLRDFDFVGVLGVGGFGRVELVTLKKNPKQSYALKCMKKVHIVETKQQDHMYSERDIMRDSDCPFIVQLFRTFKNDRYVYMLMEPCLGGELWAKLRDDGYFDEPRSRFYAACVIEALDYLHLRGIVYRDLKPENLLLDPKGYVKVVDFGFAKIIKHGEKTWTFCGTPEYVAPEVILNKGHDVAVDYWALGILIFEMLTGNPPFNSSDSMTTYRLALRGIDAIEWPQKLSRSASNLIRRLCRENPAERIGNLNDGVKGIRNHRWFAGFDWKALQEGTYNVPYIPEIAGSTDLRNFDQFEREEETVERETSGWDASF